MPLVTKHFLGDQNGVLKEIKKGLIRTGIENLLRSMKPKQEKVTR